MFHEVATRLGFLWVLICWHDLMAGLMFSITAGARYGSTYSQMAEREPAEYQPTMQELETRGASSAPCFYLV